MKTLDGYIRVSDKNGREGPSYISPDVQKAKIQDWADAKGIVIARWFKDEDKTGQNTDRPGFTKMMARVEAGLTGGVIVARTDRFSRDRCDQEVYWKKIKQAGAVYIDAMIGNDMPDDMTDLMLGIYGVLAQMEGSKIGGNWLDAREVAISNGVQIGRAPVGYKIHDRSLVPNSAAAHIRRAFEMRVEGAKLTEIADYLAGHRKPGRAKRFNSSTVSHILKNRTYLGEVRSGQFSNPNAHEAIVPRELWEAAQSKKTREVRKMRDHLLTGIIRCASCRHTMQRDTRINPALDHDYRCPKNHVAGRCPDGAVVNQPAVERYVEQQFLRFVKKLPEHPDFAEARANLDEARTNLATFLEDTELQGVLSRDAYLAAVRDRQSKLLVAETQYTAAVATSDGVDPAMIAESWHEMTRLEKRDAMKSLIDAVFVRNGEKIKDRVHICWRGEGPEMPTRGHHSADMAAYSW